MVHLHGTPHRRRHGTPCLDNTCRRLKYPGSRAHARPTHHHRRRTSASIDSSRPATPTPSYTPTCTPWDEWLHEAFQTTAAQAPSTTPAKPSHAIPSQAGAKPPPVSVSLAHTSSGDAIHPLHLPQHACTPRADHPLVPSAPAHHAPHVGNACRGLATR